MISSIMKILFLAIFISSFLSVRSSEPFLYDVAIQGVAGDGRTDATKAFMNAWDAVCKSNASSSIFRVSKGKKYFVHPLVFNGGCQSKNITFEMDGILIAPSEPSTWKCDNGNCQNWITFQHFDGLIIKGKGSFHEQGKKWWKFKCNQNKFVCSNTKASTFAIVSSNNVKISGLTFVDGRKRHISISNSSFVHLSGLTIKAPKRSSETVGIRIKHSTNVTMLTSSIKTGDDCVRIGDGSKNIAIDRIVCDPGYGISIGSLGFNGRRETVENVHVKHVIFSGTQYGVRIKTLQGGHGYARHLRFEHLKFNDVANPVVIDQYICPHHNCRNHSSAVKISDVTYYDLVGASTTETAVQLLCSESVPCKKIRMKEIYLDYITKLGEIRKGVCSNVLESLAIGEVQPDVPCLLKT